MTRGALTYLRWLYSDAYRWVDGSPVAYVPGARDPATRVLAAENAHRRLGRQANRRLLRRERVAGERAW